MSKSFQNNGFSLTEVLMAAGILAIGFAFIAGMFPVGVKLTALATEQTIAPIVVDEAIAKIKLYVDPIVAPIFVQSLSTTEYRDFYDIAFLTGLVIPDEEFRYPSVDISPELKKYYWSALCRRDMVSNEVHVIIFVSRKAGGGAKYRTHNSDYTRADYGQVPPGPADGDWPVPIRMVAEIRNNKRRLIIDAQDQRSYISTGSTIVDDATGRLYRVLKRRLDDDNVVIVLDRKWQRPAVLSADVSVWVVPPAVGSGRNPCVKVDPTHTIRF